MVSIVSYSIYDCHTQYVFQWDMNTNSDKQGFNSIVYKPRKKYVLVLSTTELVNKETAQLSSQIKHWVFTAHQGEINDEGLPSDLWRILQYKNEVNNCQ